ELTTPDGRGRYNVFEGGMIYWTPETGAHFVTGLTQLVWAGSGYEKGEYGYPIGDSYINDSGDTVQNFEKKQLNLTQLIKDAGDTLISGKPISTLLVKYLSAELGQDYAEYIENHPVLQANDSILDDGGVPVPTNPKYIYDPKQGYLNDYCTKSPDEYRYRPHPDTRFAWGTRGARALRTNANFRGPCARHDQCYEKLKYNGRTKDQNSAAYADCNRRFRNDLHTVCKNVYDFYSPANRACRSRGNIYYDVVVAVHPDHWPGHLLG
ncbi:hypothetical protein FHE74_10440, partial [Corynebacterium tapiri]